MTWSSDDLARLDHDRELDVAALRDDRPPERWTPIWVVVADCAVFVRTWQRRTTGWYGRAVSISRLWIRLGAPVEVAVACVGDGGADAVDEAYRRKYGAAGSSSMTSAESVASTLRLDPVE